MTHPDIVFKNFFLQKAAECILLILSWTLLEAEKLRDVYSPRPLSIGVFDLGNTKKKVLVLEGFRRPFFENRSQCKTTNNTFDQ
jgi:hypothetical protein